MSKALLKKSMQILEDSKPKHIFTAQPMDSSKTKNGKVKKKKNKVPVQQTKPTTTSKVDDNVRRLLKMSGSFKLNDKLVRTAFERSASRHYTLPPKEKEQEEAKSVFTEEDFARFAAEYTV